MPSPSPKPSPSPSPSPSASPSPKPSPSPSPSPSPTPSVLTEAALRVEGKILAGALVSPAEVSGLTPQQLRLLRNTVYARYGRVFRDDDLRQHFVTRPWYSPRDGYSDRLLTTNDRANADLLKAFEENDGAPPRADPEDVSNDVADAIEEWADATRERKLDKHMSRYADTLETFYKRQNVPASQVRAERQDAFTRYDEMRVELSKVLVTPDPTGLRATATFDKTWEFDSPDKNTKGSVRQQLTLVKAGGRWLINGEKDLQVYYTNSQEY